MPSARREVIIRRTGSVISKERGNKLEGLGVSSARREVIH